MNKRISEIYRIWIKFSKDVAGSCIMGFVFLLTARVQSDNPDDGLTLFWKIIKSVSVCVTLSVFWITAFLIASFACASTVNWFTSWFTVPYGGLLRLPFLLVVVLWSCVPCLWYVMCFGIQVLVNKDCLQGNEEVFKTLDGYKFC
jgi:hypothetical protein